MEESKIKRRQLENQEEARNERIPNFSLYGPGRHRLKEGLLFPLHTKPTIPFSGICAMLIEYCKYVQLRLDTDCNIF